MIQKWWIMSFSSFGIIILIVLSIVNFHEYLWIKRLMTILICYDYSFNISVINTSFQIFDNVHKLNRENLILIFQYIITKKSNDSRDNIWAFKSNDLVNSNINLNINEYSKIKIVGKISNNIGIILQNLSFLLNLFKTDNDIYIINFLQNLPTKNYEDIDILFREKIFRVENINDSILGWYIN